MSGTTNARVQVQRVARFELESGYVLRDVQQAFQLVGGLNERRDNLVLVVHSLTGGPDAADGWWSDAIGPGRPIDTERFAVLSANLLGSCYGTTGAAEAARRPFPRITTRDMARFIHLLVEELGVSEVALATGGSLGGMVVLEWLATFPLLTRRAVVFAAPAKHGAQAIAWNHIQRTAIQLGGDEGLALARMAAMITYRTGHEFEERFGRRCGEAGDFDVAAYLEHHGRKLVQRFDRHVYVTLTHAMDSHDIGRGRSGVAAALAPARARLVGVGIPGDVLYPESEVQEWVRQAGAEYRTIETVHGHDGFLIETLQAGAILAGVLADSPANAADLATVGSR